MADHKSIYCPSCERHTSISERARYQPTNGESFLYEIGECNNCSQCLLVVRAIPSGSIVRTYPTSLPRAVDDSVPAPIKKDLEESLLCVSVGAFRAAATMARRAVQNICLERGAPATREVKDGEKTKSLKNDLARQIDWLHEQRIITTELKDWAHEVRVVGNAGAHPGDAEDKVEVTEEDAQNVIELAEALCSTLYIKPKLYRDRHAKPAESTD